MFSDHAYFVIHAHPEVPFSTVNKNSPCVFETNCAFKRIHRLTDSISTYEVMHHYSMTHNSKFLNINAWCEKESIFSDEFRLLFDYFWPNSFITLI